MIDTQEDISIWDKMAGVAGNKMYRNALAKKTSDKYDMQHNARLMRAKRMQAMTKRKKMQEMAVNPQPMDDMM